MAAPNRRKATVPLSGSERVPLAGARISGKLDPNERILVTVILRPRSAPEKLSAVAKLATQRSQNRSYLTREQLASRYGAAADDIARVEAFARDNTLDVVEENPGRRSVTLSGTIANFSKAFGVKLARYSHPRGIFRVRSGPIYLPVDLAPVVQAVLGLDNRPQAKSHTRFFKKRAAAGGISYTPPQVAQLYDFPTGLDGSGQSVAIIELGGGYTTKDLQAYFSALGIPIPSVLAISVDGANNSPTGDPNGPDAEVMLDIEIIGSIAPKASIYVYFTPNTDAGFVDAVSAAVNDTLHKPSIISISWGDAESTWSSQGIQAFEQAFQDASLVGVTVAAASGDGGSSDGVSDELAHVDFPASSPYVLGCGGTQISTSSNKKTIVSEVVWNDQPTGGGATGGGVSDLFPLPAWQSKANVPPSANAGGQIGRGVPDVSGDADPSSGYLIQADGTKFPVGGTSAVAPLWTALLTLINQDAARAGKKPIGYLNPTMYESTSSSSGALRDITTGNNGAYSAGPGWDACTGLGSPDGAKLLPQLEPASTTGTRPRR